MRNACVAAGNSGDTSLVPALIPLLSDSEPLVRGHAAWALGRLSGVDALFALREARAQRVRRVRPRTRSEFALEPAAWMISLWLWSERARRA